MDRLADRSLRASIADIECDKALPKRVSVLILGGGIVGCSIALHLAELGFNDVLLLERGVLTNGTTWHAAGLIANARGSIALTEVARYSSVFYERLEQDANIDVGLTRAGSVTVARTPGRMDELLYAHDIAQHCNVESAVIDREVLETLWPLADVTTMIGGLHFPGDGYVNPGYACIAIAKKAADLGVTVREESAVLELLHSGGVVRGVRTGQGDVSAETVVLAGGLWSRDIASTAGVHLPLYAAEHVHVRSNPIDQLNEPPPVLRDVDNSYYIRAESNHLLVGAFEPNGVPRSTSEISPTGFAEFDPNWEHFAPVRAKAEESVPILTNVGYDRFINAPESFTPDTNFLIGETAELDNLYVAAGMNSQGIIYGPGVGKEVAAWILNGATQFDSSSVDVQRFSRHQSNRRYLHERTRESLGRLYAMHWPHYQSSTARGVRRSPLHNSLVEREARFGEVNALERANYFGGPLHEEAYSYDRPGWFDQVASEHRSARENVALFDLSAFSKFEAVGSQAAALCRHVATANTDVPTGGVVYSLFLNAAGGIEFDGTVTALSDDRFLIVTPSTSHTKALAHLSKAARRMDVHVVDVTTSIATIGVMGPRSRELLARVSPDNWSNAAQGLYAAREVEIADVFAWVLRLSYVGELGYEIYVSADAAENVYEALWEAGQDLSVQAAGFFALDSLRLEKGYRHLGHDIGPTDDPFSAGLGFAVDKNPDHKFMGAEALRSLDDSARGSRTIHALVSDPNVMLVHDESLFADGVCVGRLTSGGFGHTLGSSVGIGRIIRDVPLEASFTVRSRGHFYPILVSARPFYDPTNSRMRDENESGEPHA